MVIRLVTLAALIVVAGCSSGVKDDDYVARLGDQFLSQEELTLQLSSLPVSDDSLEARQQIIEQWVSNQLLYQEARRSGLRNDAEVQRMLEENERSVLVSALVSRMYDSEELDFEPGELEAYYERNRERLRLREPFVNVRYIAVRDASSAETVRAALMGLDAQDMRGWERLVERHALTPEESQTLAESYVAEARVFAGSSALRNALARLNSGQAAPVIEDNAQFHVLLLVDRAQSGTIPDMAWIDDEVRRRLLIEARKQMYARQVQRLRNEALAREDLEIR